jgi:V/A-type H+-transporting ATPase subunit D
MSRLPQNKQTLTLLRRQLGLYERMLPSLDLKRKQLTAEVNAGRRDLARREVELDGACQRIAGRIPMRAHAGRDLSGLVKVEQVRVRTVNFVGVALPELEAVETAVMPYSYLGQPHWVDTLADELQDLAVRLAELEVARRRLALLEQALRKVTQRVNLFEKVLIPESRERINRIRIFLSDQERAAVVRSKIFKNRLQDKARAKAEAARREASA